ncbi:MAG: hypothetical protein JXC32_06820 [Anaerolineae bacterium]|nr:hypothetical protein [Anaerolineae bacterium]
MTGMDRFARVLVCIVMMLLVVPTIASAAEPPPGVDRQPVTQLQHPLLVTAAGSDGGGPVGTEFTVADLTANVARPAIAYNSQAREYLVVWQTEGATNPGSIWATRVAADGRWLGNYEVEVGGGALRSHPDVAYNSQDNDYYVVWQHDTGTRVTIRGKPFAPGGPDYGSVQLTGGAALKDCFEPAIAYATNPNPSDHRFIVVWERHVVASVSSDIEGQVLTNGGAYAGDNFIIDQGTTTRSYSQPDIAYNLSRNEYLVATTWHDKVAPNYDILGRILSRTGGVLSDPAYLIGYHTPDEWAPAVAALPTVANYGGYVVAWELRHTPAEGDIYARYVPGRMAFDPTAQLGNVVIVSNVGREQVAPAIAANTSNRHYLVSWAEQFESPFDANTGIRGRELAADATVWGPVQWLGGAFSAHPAVAPGQRGDFLTAWAEGGLFGASDIHGRLWGRRVYLPLVVRRP